MLWATKTANMFNFNNTSSPCELLVDRQGGNGVPWAPSCKLPWTGRSRHRWTPPSGLAKATLVRVTFVCNCSCRGWLRCASPLHAPVGDKTDYDEEENKENEDEDFNDGDDDGWWLVIVLVINISNQRPDIVLEDPLIVKLPQVHIYFQQCLPHLMIMIMITLDNDDHSPQVLSKSWGSCDLPTVLPGLARGGEASRASCGTE